MFCVGLDLGRHLGVAIGEAGKAPALTTRTLPVDLGTMLSEFEGCIRAIISDEPDCIAYEKPFINPRAKSWKREYVTVQRLFTQEAIILKLAHEIGQKVEAHNVRSVRAKLCGRASASEEEITQACFVTGSWPSDSHQADAGLIWRSAIGMDRQLSLVE